MNRTTLLLLAVVLLGVLAFFALREERAPRTLADDAERQFAYPDLDNIGKIFVADREGNEVMLTRGGPSKWLADGKPANPSVMSNILSTVSQLEVQSLPAHALVPTMVENLATEGILVRVFDLEGNKVRGYYVGGPTNDERGVYAIMEGSENPYIVHQPTFTGNVRHRFSHQGDEWRDKQYFRVDPEKVESLSIEYPKQQKSSFLLTRDGDGFRLSSPNESRPARRVQRGVAERVLAAYENYYVNVYENANLEDQGAAKKVLEFARIRVKEEGKEPQTMVLYPKFKDRTFRQDPKTGNVVTSDGLAAYGAYLNDGEDWALLTPHTTQKLLVGYDSF